MVLLLGLFALAILVRLPNLDRPLSKHHEFCTALSLIVIQAWYDGGIDNYHLAPSTNFPQEENYGIRNLVGESVVRDGRYYYLSHPPLAYYVPFAVFKSIRVRPNVLGLQAINMVAHLLSALFIFLIARLLFFGFHLAVWGTLSFYLFNPATLWFQGNVYMADMFVQPFFLMSVYFFAVLSRSQVLTKRTNGTWLGLALSLFAAVYTEWLGILLALVFFIVGFRWRAIRWRLSFVVVIAAVSATILTTITYASIAGWDAMQTYYLGRFDERGLGGDVLGSLAQLGKNYVYNHLPMLLFLVCGSWLLLARNRSRKVFAMSAHTKVIVVVTTATVLLHHIIFLQYSGHDFAVLKSAVPLSLACGWLTSLLVTNRVLSQRSVSVAIGLVAAFSIAQYYYINRPGDVSLNGDRYASEKEIGLRIAANVAEDEVAMVRDLELTPQILYYAQRNVKPVGHLAEAYDFVRRHPLGKGVLIWMEDGEWKKRVIVLEEE